MFQDLRYGLRILLKKPAFTLIAVLSLALGIGANTAIFTLLDVVMLKSLPVREPEKLVLFGKAEGMGVTNSFPNESWQLFSYPFYREVQQHPEIFSGVTAVLSIPWNVHGTVNANGSSGEIEPMHVQLISGTYFSVLGVNSSLGRTFTHLGPTGDGTTDAARSLERTGRQIISVALSHRPPEKRCQRRAGECRRESALQTALARTRGHAGKA